jgi:two-component system phosphate regulon response regulator PhoB
MTGTRRILVADGDPAWRLRIAQALASPSHAVTSVAAGPDALAWAQRERPDLLVTELMLPELSGLGLCRVLREDPALESLGIVVVTGFSAEIDRILAYESGIDDFLPKPFYARELLSRAAAVLRRSAQQPGPVERIASPIHSALLLHPDTGTILVDGERCELTPREFHLLAALMREGGRVLTRRQLIQGVWGSDSLQAERVVDAHIKAIRRKLGALGDCVETVRGVGYRYAEPRAQLHASVAG